MKLFDDLSKMRQKAKKKEREKLDLKGLIKTYKVFGRHYKKYWKILTVAYLFLFATIGVAVLAPWPLKLILDHLILDEPLEHNVAFLKPIFDIDPKLLLLVLALAIVVLAVLEAVFSYINKFYVSSTGDRINADIRERVFAHLQRLSLSFHDSARSGNLVYLLTSDAKEMSAIMIDFPQDFTQRIVTFGAYAAIMLALDWRLGLIALSTVPLIYLFTKYFGASMKGAIRRKREREGEVASIVGENVTAMALVQAYGREDTERSRFNVEVQQSLDAQLNALRFHKTYSRITDFLVTMSTAGVLYFGGRYALQDDITAGTLVLFVSYLRDVYGSFDKFSGLFIKLAQSQVSAERLLDLVENDMVVRDQPKAIPAPAFKGRIEFRDVSFAYKRGQNVLKHLNFVVEPGETVALVGHSGAGKSTLISLLLRFYDPQQGQILIDGTDIRQFTIKSLREQMTILLQDAMLFRQTVRENIAFGKKDATEEEIINAARRAEAHEFICQMPEGYDTMMYEGGDNLSGGQKQRINIARAIIRNTPIVILDEPVTGLDAKAEAKVNLAIQHLTRGKTTFIIAHKFSTIVNADKILLLEEGQLAHVGTHQQLLRQSPSYRELYELQFGWQRELAAETAAANGGNGQLEPAKVMEMA
ncbi:MAG: ABC transporter ATP-binding protein/permease [candidate division KSB1 bacterium]|nr:ABC transporter ATP-binding protein/permease [candidate division KSB1 bacterium]MDZ7369236.1 ABC transporter ATP-binding protein/permease [candidate division KSB1 bacterium]MDZ7407230.1 ABC transporter ATP-binding protein/permease [candidate division KSB1 bacterium]